MSAHASAPTIVARAPAADPERRHRLRLRIGWILLGSLVLVLAAYGFDYYSLDAQHRPLSAKHQTLRPSGTVGVRLGMLGFLCFMGLYLYPLRKRWAWLGKKGSSKHWLDFHVLLGLAAPLVITFHSSFKFHGLAGMAYWIMLAVSMSGLVGKYLFAQIPRSLSAAELSLKELKDEEAKLTQQLAAQKLLSAATLAPLFEFPSAQRVESMSLLLALGSIIAVDLRRPFRVAGLRRRALGLGGKLATLGGFLPTRKQELEQAVHAARKHSSLSQNILFLSRSQQVFRLWHVIHRPFSYSFSLLASAHVIVVLLFGYM